ncbi:cinnamoyl-CoA reductase 1-like isoform X1 [Vicia villosa]|uniref:cinnamoyl-CoA reductase 1-like isoform X1 n=1 Tax=Vicia villosa TaxID=3911 RepID=UPI00273BE3D1|nr:cinnamoyl-CoA reductase 1-like isoform X1 [Vicia villosa]XP_058785792.1 cinnamoyl-CoA reductase 1-like isoform X1 [Vicia villosa]
MTTFPNQLRLFKSNILDYSSILPAVVGCRGVFHLACPISFGHVKNPLEEVIEPAIQGTCNVLQACKIANVKRIVYVSSGAAIIKNPYFPKTGPINELSWSNGDFCLKYKRWYCYAKTMAEKNAVEIAKRDALDLISICPTHVMGPLSESPTNANVAYRIFGTRPRVCFHYSE